jgi:hypothetical protein
VYHHEYSAGGGRRGKNRDIRFENIHVLSDKLPQFFFQGYDKSHKTENILISNFYLNGEQIKELPKSNWHIGEFAENIWLK